MFLAGIRKSTTSTKRFGTRWLGRSNWGGRTGGPWRTIKRGQPTRSFHRRRRGIVDAETWHGMTLEARNLESGEPSVAVVIPAFNCDRWLTQAIESIRVQSLANFELIIVDDGSTDQTAQVAPPAPRQDLTLPL